MAQGNFDACLAVTLKYEGGKADNPADPGGRTNEGITQRVYDGYRRGKGEATQSVYCLTVAERNEIYERLYWTPAKCDALRPGLDLCHFDATVNSGLGESGKWLKVAQAGAPNAAIHAYSSARLRSLESFRTWATFGKGWSTRVAGVEATALTMAGLGHPTLAAAGAGASTTARAASAAAHVGTAVAGACALAAQAHPVLGLTVGLASALGAAWGAWTASAARARAAVLTYAAATEATP